MKMYFDQHEGSALNNHAKDKHEGEDKPQYVMKILHGLVKVPNISFSTSTNFHRVVRRRTNY